MSEREIHRRLYFDYASSRLILPNFAPLNWFECDFYRVTHAGYFYEYEIKISIADFRADKKKSDYDRETKGYVSKHDQIRSGKGPTRFYYVVPEELEEKIMAELPEFAGLIVLKYGLRIIKQAPIIHKNKVKNHVIREARKRVVGRYWDYFLRMPDVQRIKRLEEEKQLEAVV